MGTNSLVPIPDCWVCRKTDRKRLGVVVDRALEAERWWLDVRWADGSVERIPLTELACGIQPGWTVQDVPLSAVRRSLGAGRAVQSRVLAGREQILVQWDGSGRSSWVPYENLRRIKDAAYRYVRREPGASDAPERFRLRLLAHALESWNDLTGALDRLDIDPLPHQIQLVHRIVNSGNGNWLIADDVGLGKTIEVGLLLAALERQGRARRVLIVAPAGLTRQWRDEMQYKFSKTYSIYGIDFFVDEPLHWKLYDHVIVSLDLAKRDEHRERLEAAGEWDLVVFDEAHRLTRHADGTRTDRYRLAESLRKRADGFLLLSATPHQGYTDRFKGLLELVRPDLKPQIEALEAEPEIVGEIILRNRKSTVTDAEGNFIFRGVVVHRIAIAPSPATQRFQRLLRDYLQRGYRASDEGGAAGRAIGFVMVIYRKLASSSIAAIERALRTRMERLSTGEGGQPAAEILIEDLFEGGDDQDDLAEPGANPAFFADELSMLRDLLAAAEDARRDDEKMRIFLESVVDPLVAEDKRLLVFTEYRATQSYLEEALRRRYPDRRVVLINGSMDLESKLEAIEAFRRDAFFLVSTEAGGEGLNLQDSCHVMVNYDLPWNPARLVQRMGRLYRYGQRETVIVFNLHATDSFDNAALSMMLDRVMTVVREMAHVSTEFNESLRAEIIGELLENLDMASVLAHAANVPPERTREEIEEAVRRAQQAKRLQDEFLSYAKGFDPHALDGTLGLTMQDVAMFVEAMLPFVGVALSNRFHDGRVLEVRLPEEMRGTFSEFGRRTIVRITTDRRLAQRHRDVVLLDFESSFFRHLVRTAQDPSFGGTYAVLRSIMREEGALAAYRLRWQNDQGDPTVEAFLVLHRDRHGRIEANPPFVRDWLRTPLTGLRVDPPPRNDASEVLQSLQRQAESRLGSETSKFKHPNGLVLLAAADAVSLDRSSANDRRGDAVEPRSVRLEDVTHLGTGSMRQTSASTPPMNCRDNGAANERP